MIRRNYTTVLYVSEPEWWGCQCQVTKEVYDILNVLDRLTQIAGVTDRQAERQTDKCVIQNKTVVAESELLIILTQCITHVHESGVFLQACGMLLY